MSQCCFAWLLTSLLRCGSDSGEGMGQILFICQLCCDTSGNPFRADSCCFSHRTQCFTLIINKSFHALECPTMLVATTASYQERQDNPPAIFVFTILHPVMTTLPMWISWILLYFWLLLNLSTWKDHRCSYREINSCRKIERTETEIYKHWPCFAIIGTVSISSWCQRLWNDWFAQLNGRNEMKRTIEPHDRGVVLTKRDINIDLALPSRCKSTLHHRSYKWKERGHGRISWSLQVVLSLIGRGAISLNAVFT